MTANVDKIEQELSSQSQNISKGLLKFLEKERAGVIKRIESVLNVSEEKGLTADTRTTVKIVLESWTKEKLMMFTYGRYSSFMKKLGKKPLILKNFKAFKKVQSASHPSYPYKRFLHIEREKMQVGCTVINKEGKEYVIEGITAFLELQLNDGTSSRPSPFDYKVK
jgi:hypothetical protein